MSAPIQEYNLHKLFMLIQKNLQETVAYFGNTAALIFEKPLGDAGNNEIAVEELKFLIEVNLEKFSLFMDYYQLIEEQVKDKTKELDDVDYLVSYMQDHPFDEHFLEIQYIISRSFIKTSLFQFIQIDELISLSTSPFTSVKLIKYAMQYNADSYSKSHMLNLLQNLQVVVFIKEWISVTTSNDTMANIKNEIFDYPSFVASNIDVYSNNIAETATALNNIIERLKPTENNQAYLHKYAQLVINQSKLLSSKECQFSIQNDMMKDICAINCYDTLPLKNSDMLERYLPSLLASEQYPVEIACELLNIECDKDPCAYYEI